MTQARLANILGGILAVALAAVAIPAFAGPSPSVHSAVARPTVAHPASTHVLPSTLVATTSSSHHALHAHHRRHPLHHSTLTKDLSASLPPSLPSHPAGLPHSGRAAAAHHAPTVVVRQGKGSSRAASFLAERFAWRADRLAIAVSGDEHGISKNQSFDVKSGRGPPRAGPFGDTSAPSASRQSPASKHEHPTYPASPVNDLPLARRVFGVPPSAAAFATREPMHGAATLGERCRTTRSRLAPTPAFAAPEARRIA